MNDLFTINLLIFRTPLHFATSHQSSKVCLAVLLLFFFSCWLIGLGNGCSHFPLCVKKRQHFYTSEFYFTLGFQGNTVSFSCQQTLTFRSQISDACKIHFQLYRFKNIPNNKSIHFCGFNRSYFGLWLMDFNPFCLFVFFLLPVGLYCVAFFLCV